MQAVDGPQQVVSGRAADQRVPGDVGDRVAGAEHCQPDHRDGEIGQPSDGEQRQSPQRKTCGHRGNHPSPADESGGGQSADDTPGTEDRGQPADARASDVEQGERHDHDQNVERPAAEILGCEQLCDEAELEIRAYRLKPTLERPLRLLDHPRALDRNRTGGDVGGVRQARLREGCPGEADGRGGEHFSGARHAEEDGRQQRTDRLGRRLDDADHDACGRQLGRLLDEQRQEPAPGRVRDGGSERENGGKREECVAGSTRFTQHRSNGCNRGPDDVHGKGEPLSTQALGERDEHRCEGRRRKQLHRDEEGDSGRACRPVCEHAEGDGSDRFAREAGGPRSQDAAHRRTPMQGAQSADASRGGGGAVVHRGDSTREVAAATVRVVSFWWRSGDQPAAISGTARS